MEDIGCGERCEEKLYTNLDYCRTSLKQPTGVGVQSTGPPRSGVGTQEREKEIEKVWKIDKRTAWAEQLRRSTRTSRHLR